MRDMPGIQEPLGTPPDPKQPLIYQIRIEGHLGSDWTDWFSGLVIAPQEDGTTLLTGHVADQAALHGLLRGIRDLGVPLLSVNQTPQGPPDQHRSDKE